MLRRRHHAAAIVLAIGACLAASPAGATSQSDPADGVESNEVPAQPAEGAEAIKTITVNSPTVTEGANGTRLLSFLLFISGGTGGEKVDVRTISGGTATVNADFTALPITTITFVGTRAFANVTVNGDLSAEADETVRIRLSNPVGATLAAVTATGTIVDDDSRTMTLGDVTVAEGTAGNTTAVVNVVGTLNAPALGGERVVYTAVAGTATNGDFIPPGVVTRSFATGQTTINLSVSVRRDAVPEPDEFFTVSVLQTFFLPFSDLSATVTLLNDDQPVTVTTVSNPTITEGNSGTKNATFTISLNQGAIGNESFRVTTANGTAVAPGDYSAVDQTITFITGQSSKTVTVAIKGDTAAETDETFTLQLTQPTNIVLADSSGTATITNDDGGGGGGLSIVSISNPSIVEANSGTKAMTFTVTLSGPAVGGETFTISTANGTATAGSDYVARTTAVITLAAGATTRTVTITTNGDTVVEANETLLLNIVSAIGLTIGDNQATGTITNND